MLRVRALTPILVGPVPAGYSVGDEFELEDGQAGPLLQAGYIERVERIAPVPEMAVVRDRGERATRFGRPAR